MIYAEPSTGKYFHLIRAGSAGIGHLDGLMATQDSLFVADLTGVGSLQTNNATGKIYQIQAVSRRIGCAGGPPQLLVSVQPNTKSIVLTWSALAVPCELQQSSSLGAQHDWSRIENPPQRQNDLYSREFEVSESPTFYRLHCPECDPSATSATSSASRRTLQF